jgi:AraC family transcriptional regulator of adaptative response/methylated-DNA-[protein]-cysteine methyltransferase
MIRIEYATFESALGHILVAATANGICAVYMGDHVDPMVSQLHHAFCNRSVRKTNRKLLPGDDKSTNTVEIYNAGQQRSDQKSSLVQRAGQAIASWLSGQSQWPSDLPLDFSPTTTSTTIFHMQVWKALVRIPPGETRSYKQLAVELGRPNAARAVGRACALNPISLLVPCHRVLSSSGQLTGFEWGLSRKKQLLDFESAALGSGSNRHS